MSQINSPYSLPKIRPINEYSSAQNNHLTQLERILQQIYNRIGGTVDSVSDTDVGFSNFVTLDMLEELSTSSFSPAEKEVNHYSVSSSHTTSGDEFIRATASCTITLNPSPEDKEQVQVQPTGYFLVTVSGNINDVSQVVIHGAYDCIGFQYNTALEEWIIA